MLPPGDDVLPTVDEKVVEADLFRRGIGSRKNSVAVDDARHFWFAEFFAGD